MKTPEERAAYYKGKYEALKEKMSDTGSMIKQSLIDHTIRYILIALFVSLGAFGTYYYVSHKVTETVIEIKKDVKDSIPHPIEATKKWFKKDHWWNSDKNDTSELTVERQKVSEVAFTEKRTVSQNENTSSWRNKLRNLKFWDKKDKNTTKEK